MRVAKSLMTCGLLLGGLMSSFAVIAEPAVSGDATTVAPIAAVWVPHEVSFSYMGFTSYYSCDGLESKLKMLLTASGARSDLKVIATCSDVSGGPSRLSSARLSFATLALQAPADSKDVPVPALAEWRTVSLHDRTPAGLTSGDCELVEQFAHELLPLFTVRDQVNQMSCIPHQVSIAGIRLQYSVLAPIPEPKAR